MEIKKIIALALLALIVQAQVIYYNHNCPYQEYQKNGRRTYSPPRIRVNSYPYHDKYDQPISRECSMTKQIYNSCDSPSFQNSYQSIPKHDESSTQEYCDGNYRFEQKQYSCQPNFSEQSCYHQQKTNQLEKPFQINTCHTQPQIEHKSYENSFINEPVLQPKESIYPSTCSYTKTFDQNCQKNYDQPQQPCIFSEQNIMNGEDNVFLGSYNQGNGDSNILCGSYNCLDGNMNVCLGDENMIKGDQNRLTGDCNHIQGDSNTISSDGNFVAGCNNVIMTLDQAQHHCQ